MFHFRKGLPARILDLLSQQGESILTLGDLIDATLKIDVRHHERQKEKRCEASTVHPPAKKDTKPTTATSSQTPANPKSHQSASKPTSKVPSEISKVLSDGKLQSNEKDRRMKAGLCLYCGGTHKLDDCTKRAARKTPSGKV